MIPTNDAITTPSNGRGNGQHLKISIASGSPMGQGVLSWACLTGRGSRTPNTITIRIRTITLQVNHWIVEYSAEVHILPHTNFQKPNFLSFLHFHPLSVLLWCPSLRLKEVTYSSGAASGDDAYPQQKLPSGNPTWQWTYPFSKRTYAYFRKGCSSKLCRHLWG